MTDIIQELRSLVAKATPGPWAYRPREFDDWGFIRVAQADAEGWQPIVALGRAGPVESDHDEHRRNKTDPYGPNAELIVAAINHLPALLDRLEAAERGWQPIETAPRDESFFLAYWPVHTREDRVCATRWSHDAIDGYMGRFVDVADHIDWCQPTHWRPLPDAPAIREVKP